MVPVTIPEFDFGSGFVFPEATTSLVNIIIGLGEFDSVLCMILLEEVVLIKLVVDNRLHKLLLYSSFQGSSSDPLKE